MGWNLGGTFLVVIFPMKSAGDTFLGGGDTLVPPDLGTPDINTMVKSDILGVGCCRLVQNNLVLTCSK